MESLYGISRSLPYSDRCRQLTEHAVGLWDTMQTCVRPGSLDSNIDETSIVPNDFHSLYEAYPSIEKICFNGAKAAQTYRRYVLPFLNESQQAISRIQLPSTSPAHASMSGAEKVDSWKIHLTKN